MPSMKFIAIALIIAGVIVNNYTYLHDVFSDKHEGYIDLGTKSYIIVGITFAAVIVGALYMLLRSNGK